MSLAYRWISLAWVGLLLSPLAERAGLAQTSWRECHDRVWLGADYWANPMEDWRLVDGWAECVQAGGGRNIHLLTHQLTGPLNRSR